MEKGKARIKDNPPLIYHQTDISAGELDEVVKEAFQLYRDSLADTDSGATTLRGSCVVCGRLQSTLQNIRCRCWIAE